jgi:hypothetical protein
LFSGFAIPDTPVTFQAGVLKKLVADGINEAIPCYTPASRELWQQWNLPYIFP